MRLTVSSPVFVQGSSALLDFSAAPSFEARDDHAVSPITGELFSPKRKRHKPGPKGPSRELVAAIVELKRRNPRCGYQRIAGQISRAFDIPLNKDIVRRVLTKHYRPDPGSGGPSWLTFLGHTKDSLWSVDLFRCESLLLNSHWIMVVLDHCSRRIIGFAVQKGTLDGPAACQPSGCNLLISFD